MSTTWRYEYEPGYCAEIIAQDGTTVCTFADDPLPHEGALMAAAPDLLAALKIAESLIAVMGGTPDPEDPYCDRIQVDVQKQIADAIAKATRK